jgi:hypothetical protein
MMLLRYSTCCGRARRCTRSVFCCTSASATIVAHSACLCTNSQTTPKQRRTVFGSTNVRALYSAIVRRVCESPAHRVRGLWLCAGDGVDSSGFVLLLHLYLKPDVPDDARVDAFRSSAMVLLQRHATKMNPVEVMRLIPSTTPLATLMPFLQQVPPRLRACLFLLYGLTTALH